MSYHEYARMLDKMNQPDGNEIIQYIGVESAARLQKIDEFLNENYSITKELKFPFGNNYGWGYKYSHKSKHLCYLFFEKGAFTITMQISNNSEIQTKLDSLLPKTQGLWKNCYPCGNGGWIHYRVLSDNELADVEELIKVKKKPVS